MMPIYEYICKACGKTFETDKLVAGREFRHMKETGRTAVSDVCGVVVRNWSVIHFNRVPGGGRG